MSIVVNTPNGQIGRTLTERLLDGEHQVTIIHRTPSRVDDLVRKGARLVHGSIDDRQVLDRAMKGAEALFWLTPPARGPEYMEWSAEIARAAADLARTNGIRRVVMVSSFGAQAGHEAGPVGALLDAENTLRTAAPSVAILRAGWFMENFLQSLDAIETTGALFLPIPTDVAMPIVATRDVAGVAEQWLLDRSWNGVVTHGVHGPADLTGPQVASLLSSALGIPVRYQEVDLEQARQALLAAGAPPYVAGLYTEMLGAIRDGRLVSAEPRTPATTTPTTLTEFARTRIAPALRRRDTSPEVTAD